MGEPTAGWIIYTWNTELIDGSMLRLPRTKITDSEGGNMELNPRPVDVRVERPVDAAVRELLKQLRPAATN